MFQILANLLPDANSEETLLDCEVAARNAFRVRCIEIEQFRAVFHL